MFRDIGRRAINEARERGDATEFARRKHPGTTRRNYFTEAAKVGRRVEYHLHPLALAK